MLLCIICVSNFSCNDDSSSQKLSQDWIWNPNQNYQHKNWNPNYKPITNPNCKLNCNENRHLN